MKLIYTFLLDALLQSMYFGVPFLESKFNN